MNKKGILIIFMLFLLVVNIPVVLSYAYDPVCLSPLYMLDGNKAYPKYDSINMGNFMGDVIIKGYKTDGTLTQLTVLYPYSNPGYKANLVLAGGTGIPFVFPTEGSNRCDVSGWMRPAIYHISDGCRTSGEVETSLVTVDTIKNIQGIYYTPYRPAGSTTKYAQVCFYPSYLDRDRDGVEASADCNDNDKKIYPGAPEICDGKDNQCPGDTGYGTVDEGCLELEWEIVAEEAGPKESDHKIDPSIGREQWHFIKFNTGSYTSIDRISLNLSKSTDFNSGYIDIYLYKSDADGNPIGGGRRDNIAKLNINQIHENDYSFSVNVPSSKRTVLANADYWIVYEITRSSSFGEPYVYQAMKSGSSRIYKHASKEDGTFYDIQEIPLYKVEALIPVNNSCGDGTCDAGEICASDNSNCGVGYECNGGCQSIPLICDDDDLDGYGAEGTDLLPCSTQNMDCNDNDIRIFPGNANTYCDCETSTNPAQGAAEVCNDNNKADEDCDGASNCEDQDCIYTTICAVECNTKTDPLECRSYPNCYRSSVGTCEDCSGSPLCSAFGSQDDCVLGSCQMNCEWGSTQEICDYPSCASGNSDFDTKCDNVDNCKKINNENQLDCDDDLIGDACDPACNSCGDSSVCADCKDTDLDGICDEYNEIITSCSESDGNICSSGQQCIGGDLIISSDSASGRCCIMGNCGLIEVLLSGETQYTLEESECRNPNDEGVGKKLVYKYQQGKLINSYEKDCTILPDKTVPFYSAISLIITLLILISFYALRSKIFSYLAENKNAGRNKN